jgi:hypothetical protein
LSFGEVLAATGASREEAARRRALTPAPAAALRNLRREVTLYFLSEVELEVAAVAVEEELLSEDFAVVLESLLAEEDSFASELELELSEESPFLAFPFEGLFAPLA